MYLLIKYIKSVLWRVAKRLSYIKDARCLKVNCVLCAAYAIALIKLKGRCAEHVARVTETKSELEPQVLKQKKETTWKAQIQVEDVIKKCFNPYSTAFPYGNGMVLHFYQQQESSTTKTLHNFINKGLKKYVQSPHTGENFH